MARNKNTLPILGIIILIGILAFATFRSCAPESSQDSAPGQQQEDAPTTATMGPDGKYTRPPVSVPVNTDYSPPPLPSSDKVPAAALDVARQYITAKENREAYFQTDLLSWTREVGPITGPLVQDTWKGIDPAGRPGYAWTWAHQEKVKTKVVDFSCRDNPEVPSPNPTKMLSIRCGWIAVPVHANGDRVSPNDIDFVWEYNGPRGPAVLSMVNNGGWKVTMDATGIAQ